MPPTTVLFDIDHTLAFDHKLELKVLHAMCEELEQTVTDVTRQELLNHFDAAAQKQFERIRTGSIKVIDAITQQFQHLVGQVPGAKLDPHVLALAFIERVIRDCGRYLRVAPGASDLLSELTRQGFVVGVLSNGWERLQREKMRLVGFDGPLFVSDTIGYWKPDKRAFQVAVNGLQAQPDRTWFVGDSPTADVQGAKSAGLHAIWVNWEGDKYPDCLPTPDFEVRSLQEVGALLG